ncbi:MAG: hypothetical protein AAGH41_12935 [Pseudomonadota bacterium]
MNYQALALGTLLFAFASVLVITQSKKTAAWPVWLFPAALLIPFAGWSVAAVVLEGPLGFWPNHTVNMWGIQVWVDLLMSVGAAYFLLLPRARAVGMASEVWIVLICLSGSVGLFAMLVRMLFLEHQRQA